MKLSIEQLNAALALAEDTISAIDKITPEQWAELEKIQAWIAHVMGLRTTRKNLGNGSVQAAAAIIGVAKIMEHTEGTPVWITKPEGLLK